MLQLSLRAALIAGTAAFGLAFAGGLPAAAQDATTTNAAPAASPDDASAVPEKIDVPAPVQATLDGLTQGHAKILNAFKGPAGLIGLAVEMGPGQDAILYASADGKYLVQGVVVSAKGENLTQVAEKAFLPQPATADQNFAALDKTHGYVWGKADAKKELWIVFDPNCIYCHKMFEDLQAHVTAGEVKVHIIQVGFLKASSLGKAAAIMAAKDPVAALTEDETKFDTDQEEGGIAPDMSNADAVAQVKANNAWMKAQGISGTPYLLFHDTKGAVQDVTGYVQD
ncbi:thiol:disulfide interchange protein DsbG, partial [Thioclava sp. BHET1]